MIVVFQIAYFCKHLTFWVHKCVFSHWELWIIVCYSCTQKSSVEQKTLHSLNEHHSGDLAEVCNGISVLANMSNRKLAASYSILIRH